MPFDGNSLGRRPPCEHSMDKIILALKDEIRHDLVGRHRRIRAEDLFGYKRRRDAARDAALSELAELDADHL
jgi:hypothetical protein